jgi:hypothetical protein
MNHHPVEPLSAAQAREIDHICDRFERAWKAGQMRPKLQEYLNGFDEPVRTALLRQLLLLDWDYRSRAGDAPSAELYREQFPGDVAVIARVSNEIADASADTWSVPDESARWDTPWNEAGTAATPNEPPEQSGISRYELLEEIGHGGIGVVFRGRDRVLGRDLAVKVLRIDYRGRPQACRRFIEEARVGSRLQHPAIVPVHELGWFEERRPYFTMKLVQGQTLAALLRARKDANEDRPRWLSILEQICQALAYAHSKGVVHRDLKPSNVMVGAFGEVQVMDWGFAKRLTDADGPSLMQHEMSAEVEAATAPAGVGDANTLSGMMMGTPAYMPPEQARGEPGLIDARADVFALGAILCEILTGLPPYMSDEVADACQKAALGDLRDAHARLAACEAEQPLRDLAKRCLATERDARPADAGAVAKDLSAYLVSTQERLRQAQLERAAADARAAEAGAKARAERRAVRLMLALVVALLLGGAGVAWQAVVATRAQNAAVIAAAAETQAKEAADWQAAVARRAERAAVDSANAEKQAKEAAAKKASEAQAVLGYVQNHVFAAARPEGQDGGLGHEVSLRRALEAALPALDASFRDQPLVEAQVRTTLGTSFRDLGDPKIASKQFGRAREIYLQQLGPDDPTTLTSQHDLANTYADLSDFTKALKLREETLARRRAVLGPHHRDTLTSMRAVADSLNQCERFDESVKLAEEALALQKTYLAPDDVEILRSINNLAITYHDVDRNEESLKLYQEGFERSKRLVGPYHPQTLVFMSNVAVGYSNLCRYEEGLALHKEALALQIAKLGEKHRYTLHTMQQLANDYGHLQRFEQALEVRRRVFALLREKFGPDNYSTLMAMWGVASNLEGLKKGEEAMPILDECFQRIARLPVQPNVIKLLDVRMRHFAKKKDASGCRKTAEMWESLHRKDPASLFGAARYRAVTATVTRNQTRPASAGKEADGEADRAMAWLTQAVAAGYKDVAVLSFDGDLDSLRNRTDFRELVARLSQQR